ncbi:extracellular solute-binding protein [Cohnella soli]|uniref:Extracellular solute-binding protein n=1 Tax=Cohnella soli TaxID=425005 RepID=A0ABW0HZR5_9BACL
MKHKGLKLGMTGLLAAIMLAVTACSGQESGGKKEETTPPSGNQLEEKAKDPLGKFDPPIELTAARDIGGKKFRDGESISNNVWSRLYEEALGVKIKYLWTTSGGYDQKLNVSIASGALPDMFPVNSSQLKQLIDSGQIEDLTKVYEQYASDTTKQIMGEDPDQLKSATFKGKLMAIPVVGSPSDTSQVLWIRQDWLDKLGLPGPKTMQDVEAIAKAFVTQDPDGNQKNDTFGISVGQSLDQGNIGSLRGFFNGYHAYPKLWYKDASGKFVYGSVQPEIKNALAKLREMFKEGLIDKEFVVKPIDKINEQLVGGKVGIEYGAWWNPAYPLQSGIDQNPEARWVSYGIPSADSTPAKITFDFPASQYIVIKKGTKHPEAAVKMLNLMVKKAYEERDIENYFIAKDGFEYNGYPLLYASKVDGNLDIHLNLTQALEKKDPSSLNAEEASYYDRILAYRNGDLKQWYEEGMHGKSSAWPSVKEKIDKGLVQKPGFFGAPTDTMAQKGGVLTKLELETFSKIIMGEVSLDEFDKFVENWHKLGGDQIASEIEAWYSNL